MSTTGSQTRDVCAYISVPQQKASPRDETVRRNMRIDSEEPLMRGCPTQDVVAMVVDGQVSDRFWREGRQRRVTVVRPLGDA